MQPPMRGPQPEDPELSAVDCGYILQEPHGRTAHGRRAWAHGAWAGTDSGALASGAMTDRFAVSSMTQHENEHSYHIDSPGHCPRTHGWTCIEPTLRVAWAVEQQRLLYPFIYICMICGTVAILAQGTSEFEAKHPQCASMGPHTRVRTRASKQGCGWMGAMLAEPRAAQPPATRPDRLTYIKSELHKLRCSTKSVIAARLIQEGLQSPHGTRQEMVGRLASALRAGSRRPRGETQSSSGEEGADAPLSGQDGALVKRKSELNKVKRKTTPVITARLPADTPPPAGVSLPDCGITYAHVSPGVAHPAGLTYDPCSQAYFYKADITGDVRRFDDMTSANAFLAHVAYVMRELTSVRSSPKTVIAARMLHEGIPDIRGTKPQLLDRLARAMLANPRRAEPLPCETWAVYPLHGAGSHSVSQ